MQATRTEVQEKAPNPFALCNRLKKQIQAGEHRGSRAMVLIRAVWSNVPNIRERQERLRLAVRVERLVELAGGSLDTVSPVLLPPGDLIYIPDQEIPIVRMLAARVSDEVGTADTVKYRARWRETWSDYLLNRARKRADSLGVRLVQQEDLTAEESDNYASRWAFEFDHDPDVEPLTLELTRKEHNDAQSTPECRAIQRACTHLERMRMVVDGAVPRMRGKNVTVAVLHHVAAEQGDEAAAERFGVSMAQIVAAHYYYRLHEHRLQPQAELNLDDPCHQGDRPAELSVPA